MTDGPVSGAELRSAAAQGLRWSVISRPIVEFIAMGSMAVLARLIPPAEFGRYVVAALVLALGMLPAQTVGTALIQRATICREHIQSGVALCLLIGFLIIAIDFAVAAVLLTPIFGARTAEFVRLSTPAVFLNSWCAIPAALLDRRLEFRRLTILDIGRTFVTAVATLALAVAGLNGDALVLGGLAGFLVVAPLLFLWAPPPLPRLHRGPARDLLSYSLPATGASLSWIAFRNCDYAIVGARLGPTAAGLYYRAYTLGVEYQNKITQVISTVGFPVLSRARSESEMHAFRSQMAGLVALVLFPLLTLLTIVAPVLIPWFFGPAWTPAVVPTQILAIGGAATLVIDTVGVALGASGRPRALMAYGWAHFAAYATAVTLVVPLGLAAVAAAAAVVHTVFLVIAYLLLFNGSTTRALSSLLHDVCPAIASSIGLAAVAVPTGVALSRAHVASLWYLAATTVLGLGAYLVTVRLCFPSSFRRLRALADRVLLTGRIRMVVRRARANLAPQSAA